ncbi:MAG TPA: hypothetical protein DCE41_04640 [Cytophagales bacterium]|nr:hypothetical protein [Cytophagales bacterium]HAA23089.1 hypothetical protein [Cytophagales bacterium]HAP64286.1 hypothetical protein [Cytophagales bacterium]
MAWMVLTSSHNILIRIPPLPPKTLFETEDYAPEVTSVNVDSTWCHRIFQVLASRYDYADSYTEWLEVREDIAEKYSQWYVKQHFWTSNKEVEK